MLCDSKHYRARLPVPQSGLVFDKSVASVSKVFVAMSAASDADGIRRVWFQLVKASSYLSRSNEDSNVIMIKGVRSAPFRIVQSRARQVSLYNPVFMVPVFLYRKLFVS